MYYKNYDYATNMCMFVILEEGREYLSMHRFIVQNENSRKGEQGEI
jgi:hypothetical protein